MPIFEYFCGACQHHWELIVSRSAADTPPCPQCGQPGRKELSAPAFQFKGGGWYATGYSKAGDKPDSGKAEAGKSEAKSESKSEAAKPESKAAETKSADSPKSAPAPAAAKPSTPSSGA